jgi:hypothetical protein
MGIDFAPNENCLATLVHYGSKRRIGGCWVDTCRVLDPDDVTL